MNNVVVNEKEIDTKSKALEKWEASLKALEKKLEKEKQLATKDAQERI